MNHSHRPWPACAGLALALVFGAVPVRGADVDRYLPADTEIVVTFNVRQLLDAPLIKKYALEQARDTLKSIDEVNGILQDLGFDPFKDLERVIVASPGGNEQDRGLIIVHGRFDLDKFKKKGEEAAKENADALKIHKVKDGVGERLVYEVSLPEGMPLFVAMADKTTMVASTGKDYVVDALKKEASKAKGGLKNKDFQALLERMDAKQSMSFAGVGAALKEGLPAEGPFKEAKDALEKIDALGGGFTVGDDVKIEVAIAAKSADTAKDLSELVNTGLKQALAFLNILALQKKELEPFIEIVQTIKSSAKDKTVVIKGQISNELIEKAIKKGQGQ